MGDSTREPGPSAPLKTATFPVTPFADRKADPDVLIEVALSDPGMVRISCPVPERFLAAELPYLSEISMSRVRQWTPEVGDTLAHGTSGIVRGHEFILPVPHGSGTGLVREKGVGTLEVSWETGVTPGWGRCSTRWTKGAAAVKGRVVGRVPDGAYIHGCGGKAGIDEGGRFELVVDTGPCELLVVIARGEQRILGRTRSLSPEDGEVLEVDLEAPEVFEP